MGKVSMHIYFVNAEGSTCMAKNFCAGNPCKSNATCINNISSFTCICPSGYGGSLCQHNLNNCQNAPCLNRGMCEEQTGLCNCSGTGFQGICVVECEVLFFTSTK